MKLYTRADIAQPWEGLYWTTAVNGTQSHALHFWYEKLTGTAAPRLPKRMPAPTACRCAA